MRKLIYLLFFVVLALNLTPPSRVLAESVPVASSSSEASASATPVVTATPVTVPDITQKTQETLGPLEQILKSQTLGSVWPGNPVKYAIRGAVAAGVPANTIVLLLLLPIMTFVIAFSRNVVGIRGFGIFLPAALSVVFVATGPAIGIGLFLIIVVVSTFVRLAFRKLKIRLQYLPRMSFILWAVVLGVLGVLFLAPVLKFSALSNVSIFAVLILVLLSEDFTRVQLGKSVRTALNLLLNPEISLIGIAILDLLLGQYTGLRFMEFYRFRKLINQ
jgi:hypothetical protein